MLKSECTEEEWKVFADKRRGMDASADRSLDGAAELLAKPWTLRKNKKATKGGNYHGKTCG
tara:strand:+ start:740 stop:922 length:183 start_codon:yes stop_codon:yes gene_type:complete